MADCFNWAPGERDRLALQPIQNADVWEFRKKIEALHWTPQEVDLTRDRAHWLRMTAEEKRMVRHQLAFFASADIVVLDNLGANFRREVDCLEARMVYAAQEDQECAHAESYGLQIEAVMEGAEREATLNAVRTMPVVGRIRDWVGRWFDSALHVGERLVAFAAVEGILFQSSFAALQWLRERNLLPGITSANSFIARDEGVHTLFACLLVRRYVVRRPAPGRAEAIVREAIAVVDDFIDESLPTPLAGLDAPLMREYVRFQADSVLQAMGYPRAYGAANPFPFMDKLTLNEVAKTNFFEHRPSQYQNVVRPGGAALTLDTSAVPDF